MSRVLNRPLTCEICGRYGELALHHVYFGTANRRLSDKWGMVAWLCPFCHTLGPRAVHRCRETDLMLKQRYQEIFEQRYPEESFVKIFGRNYL